MLTNETLQNIKQRRSVRSYTDEQIKDEELLAILEAGMYAPNAGDQAWHFTVVQNKVLLTKLNLAAKETAKTMSIEQLRALGNNEKFDCLYGAPTLIVVSGGGAMPMPLDADCAAATQNLLLAAESLGIGSCWIFFVLMAFQSEQGAALRAEMKIPEGYKPYDVAVFGYRKGSAPKAAEREKDVVTIIK